MAKMKFSRFDSKNRMRLLDDLEETESGMYLNLLADEPGEAEAAMVLNSLVDDPDELVRETFKYQGESKSDLE
ncbi:MAG: hypothetical protein ACM3YE_10250 [Bacteroidota bacterium]